MVEIKTPEQIAKMPESRSCTATNTRSGMMAITASRSPFPPVTSGPASMPAGPRIDTLRSRELRAIADTASLPADGNPCGRADVCAR